MPLINLFVNSIPFAPNGFDTSYCIGVPVVAVRASTTDGIMLKYYTQISGGVSSSIALIPSISSKIDTQYFYVSQLNDRGFESARKKIMITFKNPPPPPIITRNSDGYLVSSEKYGNNWYSNNTLLSDTSNSFKPINSGFYNLRNTLNGCITALSPAFYYLVTDIININASEFIKLAPNPFNNQLNIDFNIKGYQKLNMEVFNFSTGNKLAQKEGILPGTPIYLGHLNSGSYIVRITSNDGKLNYQFKMIKL